MELNQSPRIDEATSLIRSRKNSKSVFAISAGGWLFIRVVAATEVEDEERRDKRGVEDALSTATHVLCGRRGDCSLGGSSRQANKAVGLGGGYRRVRRKGRGRRGRDRQNNTLPAARVA